MNSEIPKDTSSRSSSTLRPRNRRPLSSDHDSTLAGTALTSVPQLDGPQFFSSRAPSPIPSKHPSRSAPASKKLENSRTNNRLNGSSGVLGPQATPSTFASGLWGTSWSSLQGIASNLLGSDTLGSSNTSVPQRRRRRRPLEATHSRTTHAPPIQWGPSGCAERQIGHGTQEDHLAQVQAKKRETLLAANGYLNPDTTGRYKRRESPERGSAPPNENGDRDALVYVHNVKPEDTLAGVMLRYNCKPDVFRRANRLWPNDNIQVRKTVVLPVDACGIRGRKTPITSEDILDDDNTDETMQTPTNSHFGWGDSASSSAEPRETPSSSIPTSPSISVSLSNPEEPPWKHDSWVSIDGFPNPVEIARLSRQTLGFFPPRRRKSVSFSDAETPPQSLDLPETSYFDSSSLRRQKSKSRSSSGSNFATHLQGPGGVGTLGRDVHNPGPAQDGLNRMFAAHLPNVAPRASFESTTSNSSTGIENVGGAIEGWVRKLASRAAKRVQPPPSGGKSGVGDLIELSNAFEIGDDADREAEGSREANTDENTDSSVGRWSDDQERLLRERFPPRGRVFVEAPRRKGE